jgi:hypothetical protein
MPLSFNHGMTVGFQDRRRNGDPFAAGGGIAIGSDPCLDELLLGLRPASTTLNTPPQPLDSSQA